jgi:hypothetical protein
VVTVFFFSSLATLTVDCSNFIWDFGCLHVRKLAWLFISLVVLLWCQLVPAIRNNGASEVYLHQ